LESEEMGPNIEFVSVDLVFESKGLDEHRKATKEGIQMWETNEGTIEDDNNNPKCQLNEN